MDSENPSKEWYLHNLATIIKHESRFVLEEPYVSFVNDVVRIFRSHFLTIIPTGSKLYRARINKVNIGNRNDEKIPFSPDEMGPPPKSLAISGRVNPEGIPYLYCAKEPDTAGAELRPWKGAYLTIAEVEILRDIPIADLAMECKDEDWFLFFYEFSDLFSIQWPSELKLNYLVTQFFAEHFKSVGIRGVGYGSEFNAGGINYCLFYRDDFRIKRTYTVETSSVDFIFLPEVV